MGQRRMWTCLEIVIWIESNLCCQNICSSVHMNQQRQRQLDPLANSIHKSATTVQSRSNCESLTTGPRPQKLQEAIRTPPEVFGAFSLHENMTGDDQQRVARRTNTTQHYLPSVCQVIFLPFPNIKHHMPSFQVASRKAPCVYSPKHPPTCLHQQNILS